MNERETKKRKSLKIGGQKKRENKEQKLRESASSCKRLRDCYLLVSSHTNPSENIAVSTTPISQGRVVLPVIKESNSRLSSTSSSAELVSTTSIFFIDVEHQIEEDNHPPGGVLLSETTFPVETKSSENDARLSNKMSQNVVSGHEQNFLTTNPTLPYPTLPYPTLPYPTLPYPTLPYPTLPYPTLPYPTLPYPKPYL